MHGLVIDNGSTTFVGHHVCGRGRGANLHARSLCALWLVKRMGTEEHLVISGDPQRNGRSEDV